MLVGEQGTSILIILRSNMCSRKFRRPLQLMFHVLFAVPSNAHHMVLIVSLGGGPLDSLHEQVLREVHHLLLSMLAGHYNIEPWMLSLKDFSWDTCKNMVPCQSRWLDTPTP